MRRLGIPTAVLSPKVSLLPVSFPAPQFAERIPRFLQPHCIAVAIVAAIAIGSSCSETHAQQATVVHQTADGPADSTSVFSAEASQRFGFPAAWIRAIMAAESAGNLRAVSPKGAIGLMQIMPETWAELRRRYHLGTDPYDAHDNIIAGTAYMRELYDRYGASGFLPAYNAGPARWEDHLTNGKLLPLETRDFLIRLAPVAGSNAIDDAVLNASTTRSWTDAPLFPPLATNAANGNRTTSHLQALHGTNSQSVPNRTDQAPHSNRLFVVMTSGGQSQ